MNLNWDDIRDELSDFLDIDSENHAHVTQKYIESEGKNKFVDYLKRKLIINNFDDEKGYNHTALMSLNMRIMYTTN